MKWFTGGILFELIATATAGSVPAGPVRTSEIDSKARKELPCVST